MTIAHAAYFIRVTHLFCNLKSVPPNPTHIFLSSIHFPPPTPCSRPLQPLGPSASHTWAHSGPSAPLCSSPASVCSAPAVPGCAALPQSSVCTSLTVDAAPLSLSLGRSPVFPVAPECTRPWCPWCSHSTAQPRAGCAVNVNHPCDRHARVWGDLDSRPSRRASHCPPQVTLSPRVPAGVCFVAGERTLWPKWTKQRRCPRRQLTTGGLCAPR